MSGWIRWVFVGRFYGVIMRDGYMVEKVEKGVKKRTGYTGGYTKWIYIYENEEVR